MSGDELHFLMRQSLNDIFRPKYKDGLRKLLELRSAELLLTDLLFCALHMSGRSASREHAMGGRCAADIVIHEDGIVIEAKQLHLKDGCKYAIPNLCHDLARHTPGAFGVLYVLDERRSSLPIHAPRFGGANRAAKSDLSVVASGLTGAFSEVYPSTPNDALLRTFKGHGGLDVHGFVVRHPRSLVAGKARASRAG